MGTVNSRNGDPINSLEADRLESQENEGSTENLDHLTKEEVDQTPLTVKRKYIAGSSSDFHQTSPKKPCKIFPGSSYTSDREQQAGQDHVRRLFATKRKNPDLSTAASTSKKFREDFDDPTDDDDNLLILRDDQSETVNSSMNNGKKSENVTFNNAGILADDDLTKFKHFHDFLEPILECRSLSHSVRCSGDIVHTRSPWTSNWFYCENTEGESATSTFSKSNDSQKIIHSEAKVADDSYSSPWTADKVLSFDSCDGAFIAENAGELITSVPNSSNICRSSGVEVVEERSDTSYRSPWTAETLRNTESCDKILTVARDKSDDFTSYEWITCTEKPSNRNRSSGVEIVSETIDTSYSSPWTTEKRTSPGIFSYKLTADNSDHFPVVDGNSIFHDHLKDNYSQHCNCSSLSNSPWTADWFPTNGTILSPQESSQSNTDNLDHANEVKLYRANDRRFSEVLYEYLNPYFWIKR